jgi:hypothetical protein
MNAQPLQRGLWLAATAGLLLTLYWLDQSRGGPASMLSRCNYLLSETPRPPADVLIIGSSRSGVALDPLAIENMLAQTTSGPGPTVERLALGHNPLRLNHALLENYLASRGTPGTLVLELTFMTERSVDRLAGRGLAISPEQYIFRRDLNLMSFEQILQMPAVAMPYSEAEGVLNLWRFRLRGVALRAGALIYQFLRRPIESWQLDACEREDWTQEPAWPADFAFSYGDYTVDSTPDEAIQTLEKLMADRAPALPLKDWQTPVLEKPAYPYDFTKAYRAGEVQVLESMLAMAAQQGVPVILIPLPLYGYDVDADAVQNFAQLLPGKPRVIDLYGQIKADLDPFWYDDGHVERYPAGALTSALLARHLSGDKLAAAGQQGEAYD